MGKLYLMFVFFPWTSKMCVNFWVICVNNLGNFLLFFLGNKLISLDYSFSLRKLLVKKKSLRENFLGLVILRSVGFIDRVREREIKIIKFRVYSEAETSL